MTEQPDAVQRIMELADEDVGPDLSLTPAPRSEEIVDGRKLRFAVEVTAGDGRTIGVGRHERRVIDAGPGRGG